MSEQVDIDPTVSPEIPEPERRSRRSAWVAVNIIAVVVIAAMVLLLVRECGGGGSREPEGAGGLKTIESVGGRAEVPGTISVWISDRTTLNGALSAAGIEADTYVSLGRGRYLIEVPEGSENEAISTLIEQDGVFDAGFVYEMEAGQ